MADPGSGYVPAPPNSPPPFGPYEVTPSASLWRSDADVVTQRGHGWVYITEVPGANDAPWVQI